MARNYTILRAGKPPEFRLSKPEFDASKNLEKTRKAAAQKVATHMNSVQMSENVTACENRKLSISAPLGLVNCSISQQDENFDPPEAPKIPSDAAKLEAKNQQKLWFLSQSRIVGFRVYKKDIVPVRKAWIANEPENIGERGEIVSLSKKSLRRLSLIANNTEVEFRSFLTLTYPKDYPSDGKLVKKHLNAFLTALRRHLGRVEYLWFLEFQKRGAPHIHLFLDYELPSPLRPMKRVTGRRVKDVRVNWEHQDWVSDRWFEIVGSGDEKHRDAGSAWEVIEKRDGMARYVAKETYKTFQKIVPTGYRNVGRFWGTSKGVPPKEPDMIEANLEELQAFLPSKMIGEFGQPFPVCFEGAESYRKILGSIRDPARVRAWKNQTSTRPALLGSIFTDMSESFAPIPLHMQQM